MRDLVAIHCILMLPCICKHPLSCCGASLLVRTLMHVTLLRRDVRVVGIRVPDWSLNLPAPPRGAGLPIYAANRAHSMRQSTLDM